MSMNAMTVTTKEPPSMPVAKWPASGSPRRRPNATRIRNPASGRAGISQMASNIGLTLQFREIVGSAAGAAAQDRHDDAEADHDFGGRHDEHEEHRGLSVHVVELAGQRHEREVHGVEHQLDAHEQ